MEWMSAGSDYLSDRAFSEGFMSPLSNFFKEKLTEFGKAGAKITGFFFCFCFFFIQRICARGSALPHLPYALIVLLLQAHGPVIEACVRAVVHAEDNWAAQDHPRRTTTHHGAKQGLASGQG